MDREHVRSIRILLPVVFLGQLAIVATANNTWVRFMFGFGALVSLAVFVAVFRKGT